MSTSSERSRPVDAASGEYTLSLRPLLRVLSEGLWIIVLTAAVVTGTVIGSSLLQAPRYEASVKVLIGQGEGFSNTPAQVPGLQQLTGTMVEAVYSPRTAEAVIERLDLRMTQSELFDNLDAEQIPETQFIELRYRDTDPERALQVVQVTGEVFSDLISGEDPGQSTITASVWAPASVPANPVSPGLITKGFLALVVSLFLGMGLAVLRSYLDDGCRSPAEAAQVTGVPSLGVVPESGTRSRARQPTDDPDADLAEAYRVMGINVVYAFLDPPPAVISVTSPGLDERKTTTCAHLGIALTWANKSVLAVDCDFRRPEMHDIFGVSNAYGLTDILSDGSFPEATWHEVMHGLKVLTAGSVSLNPIDAFGSERFLKLVRQMREHFDYVLLNAPPVGVVAETTILATESDGVLLALDAQNSRKSSIREALLALHTVGANLFGTIMHGSRGGQAR